MQSCVHTLKYITVISHERFMKYIMILKYKTYPVNTNLEYFNSFNFLFNTVFLNLIYFSNLINLRKDGKLINITYSLEFNEIL